MCGGDYGNKAGEYQLKDLVDISNLQNMITVFSYLKGSHIEMIFYCPGGHDQNQWVITTRRVRLEI